MGSIDGTVVRFYFSQEQFKTFMTVSSNYQEDLVRFKHVLSLAIGYYNLPIEVRHVETGETNTMQPRSYLAEKKAFYSEYWNGLQIGVCKSYEASLCFHGLTLNLSIGDFGGLEDTTRTRFNLCIQVIDSTEIKLVLPARKEIVKNEFYYKLGRECARILYQAIAELPEHNLSYQQYQKAKEQFGIDLKECVPILNEYVPKQLNHYEEGERRDIPGIGKGKQWAGYAYEDGNSHCCNPLDTVIYDYNTLAEALLLWRAWETQNEEGWDQESEFIERIELVKPSSNKRGYDWYENLPVLEYVECEALVNGEWVDVSTSDEQVVDQLRLVATITNGEEEKTVYLPTDVYFTDLSSNELWVSKEFDTEASDICSLLSFAYYEYCENSETSSSDQSSNHWQECWDTVNGVLLDSTEAVKESIKARLDEVKGAVPADTKVTIILTRNKYYVTNTEITVEPYTE